MKLTSKGRVSLDELQGDWESSRETLASIIGDQQDQVAQALSRGLSTRDNTTSDFYDYVLTHDTVARIKNPLRKGDQPIPVVGIWAVRCVGMEMSGGKPTRRLYALAKPQIDWEPADSASDVLLVTPRFPAPSGACSIYRSAAYDVPDAADTIVPFDSASFSSGGLLYDTSGTAILCSKPGFVFASYSITYAAHATGYRRGAISKNGSISTEIWGAERDAAYAANHTGLSGSGLISVSAGDLIQAWSYQNSGGALALFVAQRRVKLDAHYVAPAIGTTGKVTLFFFGG